MSTIVRASAAVLLVSLAAVSGCSRNPDSTLTPAIASSSEHPEPAAPREYYGRTEFEIAGGDGQVVDHQ
jgi:hypothetical protein